MINKGLFCKHVSEDDSSRISWTGLTPETLAKARARVKKLAWLMLAVTSLGAVIDLVYAAIVMGAVEPVWVGASVAMVGLSLGLVLVAGNQRATHFTVLHASLVYEVILCLGFAVLMPWIMYLDLGVVPYMTWVTPIIIVFPLIVPSPPRLTLLAALAAAATRPLGLVILEELVGIEIPLVRYIGSSVSPAFAVGVAYVGSRIVHTMNIDLAKAKRMGSYELESRLGVGGMGEVWQARHRLLARPAAVKLVRLDSMENDPERQQTMLARFKREAQATAQMRSPHTIQLYDFGVSEAGTFYYAMELLTGLDLNALVRRFGSLAPERAVHVLLQVCDSLGEAHEQGLIHRDIKPANIYLCRYGRRFDYAKVLDFGLVKSSRHTEEDATVLTTEVSVGGTPGFTSPEQVLGDEVDGRSDIYSLGCVAFWMLTGEHVFDARTAMQTMMKHVQATPPAPSARARQRISADLDRIILACLEKNPAQRPQNADGLAALLTDCDAGIPWSQDQAKQWWEKHLTRETRF